MSNYLVLGEGRLLARTIRDVGVYTLRLKEVGSIPTPQPDWGSSLAERIPGLQPGDGSSILPYPINKIKQETYYAK